MHRSILIQAAAFAGCALTAGAETTPDAGVEFFEKKVRPILASHCYSCHSADTKPSGDLRVDDRNGLLTGGDTGPAVVPGHPEKSLLLQRVKLADGKKQMPKEGDLLTPAEIADLTQWILDGAAWPRERIPASLGRTRPVYEELKAKHWAWQPLTSPTPPQVANQDWPANEIDRFVLARLAERQLAQVGDAEPAMLLRRLSYDLTGLPPSPEEVRAFIAEPSPAAYARAVDRLLASPRFGERWGRHWLDIARYGESTGPSRNVPYPHAWRYRDYVIDSFNADVPYHRFIQEQIAGDLLPVREPEEKDRLLVATGFLALGVKDVNQRFKTRFLMDNVDEQIDTVSRAVLGLTVSCARCHDHKFDPVPVTDYYALAGIFTSTENCAGLRNKMGGGGLDYYDPKMLLTLEAGANPPPAAEQVEKLRAQVAEAKRVWDEIRGTPAGLKPAANGQPAQRSYRVKYEALQGQLLALTDRAARVHGVRDSSSPTDTEVRIRGEAERIGPTVPRGFLSAFQVPGAPAIAEGSSGRLELAQWLTDPKNPLTSRVIVNRVWAHLFGQGIVQTVDNFGVKGDVPSHPELLDYLAQELQRNGWSLKTLIRKVVLSHTYRLGAEETPELKQIDPANRLLWRHAPRRLEAEEFRDSLLATSGRLQLNRPDGSPAKALRMVEIRDNGPEAKSLTEQAERSVARSVYLPSLRGLVPKALEAFDPVTQSLVTGQREVTTVPTQALFVLNSAFVRQQSLALAEATLATVDDNEGEAVGRLYLRILGRPASAQEISRAISFLVDYALEWKSPAATQVAVAPADRAGEEEKVEPANPDDVDRTTLAAAEEIVQPKSAPAAAWMSFIQALYGSAEFRFVR